MYYEYTKQRQHYAQRAHTQTHIFDNKGKNDKVHSILVSAERAKRKTMGNLLLWEGGGAMTDTRASSEDGYFRKTLRWVNYVQKYVHKTLYIVKGSRRRGLTKYIFRCGTRQSTQFLSIMIMYNTRWISRECARL